jgi:hypothetical protein
VKWAVGSHIPHSTDAEIERAFADGRILRTHVLRPTWHFVVPDDIRWTLGLTAPRVHAQDAYYRQLELDDKVFDRSSSTIARALTGGEQLTRKQLGAELSQRGHPSRRLGYVLMNAELNGLVCSGRVAGKPHTYALLDERVAAGKQLVRRVTLHLAPYTGHGARRRSTDDRHAIRRLGSGRHERLLPPSEVPVRPRQSDLRDLPPLTAL